MANGNGIGAYTGRICVSLIIAMILGGVGLAIAQRGTDTQVETNRLTLRTHAVQVHKVPVLENEMGNIKKKLNNLETRMNANKHEILEAIKERH